MRNILLLASLLFCIPWIPLKADVFYVGADEQYKTIAGVMWDVLPGDTIIVRDGVYDKTITIKSPLTLMAENRHKAIIGDGVGTEGVFKVRSNNVVIDGFKFMDNPEWPGIVIGLIDSSKMVSNCKVLNNDIINRKYGIRFNTSSENCLVDSNIITGSSEYGVFLAGKGNHTISNNYIEQSGLCGIMVFEMCSGSNFINGNTLRLSGTHGIEIRAFDIRLKGNIISENTEFGVYTNSGLKNITLSDSNRIENNSLCGILIESNTEAILKDNIIKGNMVHGIEIAQKGIGIIKDNIIVNNEFYGILNNGSATISGNTISENKINGVENRPGSTNTLLLDNTISDNGENGVFLMEKADFSGNTISGNGYSGIYLESPPGIVKITGNNKIISNGEHGISILEGGTALIGSNIISENGTKGKDMEDFSGIFIEGTATVEENYIENNFYSGIKVGITASNVLIRHNRAINGNRNGIRLEGAAGIFRNSIKHNVKQGIIVVTSDSCEISEDTISGNATGILIAGSSTGYTSVYNCEINNNLKGINSFGSVVIRRSSIKHNTEMGIQVREKGIDLGQVDPENGGYNAIQNNQPWNLINATSDTVSACHNYWTFSDSMKIDSTIRDNDEDILIGPVIFSPFLSRDITGTDDDLPEPGRVNSGGLLEIYPNPFREGVNLNYRLAASGRVTITIRDLTGRTVSTIFRNEYHEPGLYAIKWDAQTETGVNIESGIYVIVMEEDRNVSSRIIQFVK